MCSGIEVVSTAVYSTQVTALTLRLFLQDFLHCNSVYFLLVALLSNIPRFYLSSRQEIWTASFWNFLVWNTKEPLTAISYWYQCWDVPAFQKVVFESYPVSFGSNNELKEQQREKKKTKTNKQEELQQVQKCGCIF